MPFPHSLPVKVFIPKCRNAVSSNDCHFSCLSVGTTRAAISTFISADAPSGKRTDLTKYFSSAELQPAISNSENNTNTLYFILML